MIEPGQRIGHYRIETRLGAGGMGEVFRAFDEKLERPVAIKVLPRAVEKNEEARARMLREARAASALVHPSIVTVHQVDEHDGGIFLVMEYVEGDTFSQVLARRGALPLAEALRLVRPVAAALEFAHKAGFVHRDIKCSNLMVTPDGHVKVLDFGLSKRMRRDGEAGAAARLAASGDAVVAPRNGGDVVHGPAPADAVTRPGLGGAGAAPAAGRPPSMPAPGAADPARVIDATGPTMASFDRGPSADADLTVAGAAMGTPGYSALELMDGAEADARADVFSLGVVLYELLTAARPYRGKTWADVRDEVATERYPRARELVPSLSSELDAVIEHALRADRDRRTPSVTAFVAALAHADTAGRRRLRTVAALGGITAVAGGAWVVLQLRGAPPATAPVDAGRVAEVTPDAGPADALDAAIAISAAPIRVTELGGCAANPTFIDDDTVVFDLTRDGRIDLHALALERQETRPLTDDGAWAWRPVPGRGGDQVLYLVTDLDDPTRSGAYALAAGRGALGDVRPEPVVRGELDGVAALGGALAYVSEGSSSVRHERGGVKQELVSLGGRGLRSMVASRDGRWLALVTHPAGGGADELCLVDVRARALRCAGPVGPIGRADFGTRGWVYYPAPTGIRALAPTADARDAWDMVRDVRAPGGVAVAPAGGVLVYSDCARRGVLRDHGASPPRTLVEGAGPVAGPATGAGGRLVWVHDGRELVVREPDGATRVLPTAHGGDLLARPAFARAGDAVAYVRQGSAPGLVRLALTADARPEPLTRHPGDDRPLFLDDGTVVFTRVDGTPAVYRVRPGEDPTPVRRGRRALAVDRGGGRVLLQAAGGALSWWDPATGAELTAVLPEGLAEVQDVALSPDGDWGVYRTGLRGEVVWRVALAAGRAEQLHVAPDGTSVEAAITSQGHVVIVENGLRGELWRVDAGSTPW